MKEKLRGFGYGGSYAAGDRVLHCVTGIAVASLPFSPLTPNRESASNRSGHSATRSFDHRVGAGEHFRDRL
jgi:hypothetical protein